MALTRAPAETVLLKRVGVLFTAIGLDGTTDDGTNVDLNDPLGYALRRLGYSVATITAVADADLAAVGTDEYDALLDLAELRALESAWSAALTLVDLAVGPRKEALGQLAQGLEKLLARKRAQVEQDHGLGMTLTGGYLSLDFTEHRTTED